MIARACYVICDRCGDPADEVSTGGAQIARTQARREGFVRIKRQRLPDSVKSEDVCSRCFSQEDPDD